jgi:hypothetical protein
VRSRWIFALEAFALAAFGALVSLIALRLCRDVSGWSQAPLLLGAAIAGYALADVASGLTHWFCDSFFREDTPGIGPLLIFPFREHHRDPAGMTRHGFLELTGNSALALLPLLGAVAAFPPPAAANAGVLAFAFALFATNFFHKWAHSATVPGWVACLQRCRLILRPEAHAVHHRPGNQGAYGVTNGWMNALLDRVLR